MEETEEARQYWQTEIARLTELRDNAAIVQAGLDYASLCVSANWAAGIGKKAVTVADIEATLEDAMEEEAADTAEAQCQTQKSRLDQMRATLGGKLRSRTAHTIPRTRN